MLTTAYDIADSCPEQGDALLLRKAPQSRLVPVIGVTDYLISRGYRLKNATTVYDTKAGLVILCKYQHRDGDTFSLEFAPEVAPSAA